MVVVYTELQKRGTRWLVYWCEGAEWRGRPRREDGRTLLLFGRALYISSGDLGQVLKLDSSSRVRAIEVIGPFSLCGREEDFCVKKTKC